MYCGDIQLSLNIENKVIKLTMIVYLLVIHEVKKNQHYVHDFKELIKCVEKLCWYKFSNLTAIDINGHLKLQTGNEKKII